MKHYRLCLRQTGEFEDIEAESAEDACRMVGWSIDDTWVRQATRGQFANGWRNITTRDGKGMKEGKHIEAKES